MDKLDLQKSVEPDLQFDRAEPIEAGAAPAGSDDSAFLPTCQKCQQRISDAYYEVQGAVSCGSCYQEALAAWHSGTPITRGLRALVFGCVAALLGCILYYAILKLTGYEFGLIAIVVGYAVGYAVKVGGGRRGGAYYQALAIALTYLSIVFSYLPMVFEGVMNEVAQEEQAVEEPVAALVEPATGDPATNEAASSAPPTPESAAPPGELPATAPSPADGSLASEASAEGEIDAVGGLVAVVVLMGLILAMPFLAGLENILGLIIIGFGLFEAWKINRKEEFSAAGPYRVGTPA